MSGRSFGPGPLGARSVPYICMEAWQNIQYQYQYGLILILNIDKSIVLKNRFEQLERYIQCSPMPPDGFQSTFDRIDELSDHLRVLCRTYWRPGPHLAVDETIQRFMGW